MSNFTKARIKRSHFPRGQLTLHTYRKAWDCLALDFENRCAYSMQHTYRAGGQKCMEIDHFNPRKKRAPIQEYVNLFLATRHCNGAKGNRWPGPKEVRKGLRFLNCCTELDYGAHIFEDPDTHEVVGVTPTGRYHVRYCDLNANHLIEERKERTKLRQLLTSRTVTLTSGWQLPPEFEALKTVVQTMIPDIPLLTGKSLAERRAFKKALAAIT